MLKTHSCGDLGKENIGQEVTLAGWVNRRRDHGGLIFIDLRDREGFVQVAFSPEVSKECHHKAEALRSEFVIQVKGVVNARPEGAENPKIPTGYVEVTAKDLTIFNESKTPPFYINEEVEVDESLRLKYRYLDIRRSRMLGNLLLRSNITSYIRSFLTKKGFLDVETPILIKSTPEGARDYLVPSRIYEGKFYALPQSPQQLKQLLMVAGIEKYYQFARCFRDEDTRADRQPEFTQLDLEMSFVNEEDIQELMQEMFGNMVKDIMPGKTYNKEFPKISYKEAMEKYGTDKPDLRFGMEITDISDIVRNTEFGVFNNVLSSGGKIKAICVPSCASYNKKQLEELNQLAARFGGKGLLPMAVIDVEACANGNAMESVKSVAAKFMSAEQIQALLEAVKAKDGDLILVAADKPLKACEILGGVRSELGKRLELANADEFAFCFVVGFPLFERDEEGSLKSMHHPFTSPVEEDAALLDTEPEKVHSRAYDLVLNGYEIAGGSIRIHDAKLQRKIFHLLGHEDEDITNRFGQLLEAFEYGAPPHGGIAAGIDRTVMVFAGEDTIREVIPFPKNQNAMDLLFDAPSSVSEEQLDELHIMLKESEG